MKLFIESIAIFCCTLVAAAAVALGEPGAADLDIVKAAVSASPFQGQQEIMQGRPAGWSVRAPAPSTR